MGVRNRTPSGAPGAACARGCYAAGVPHPRSWRPSPALALVLVGALLAGCTAPSASPAASGSAFASASAAEASATSAGSPTAAPSLTGSTNPPLATGPDRLQLETVAGGLVAPIGITAANDGSGRLFVNEQAGRLRVVNASGTLLPAPFVDLSDRIESGGERGLLGVALHPDFARDGRLFVDYTRIGDGATVIAELRAAPDRQSADPASERILLVVPQPYANHNGGQLAFGPDGYLYIGLGDGGSGGDPLGNGQNRRTMLGKILRIDVDGTPTGGRAYAIPSDNPYASGGAQPGAGLPEIWAYGLRNPWRFSFDRRERDLYIGDVGQGAWEEIDRQPGDSRGGENYGWNVMEGRHCSRQGCDQGGFVKPIAEYSHASGCSVTGGYVYRGTRQPALDGVYVFGDYCAGTIFTLQVDEGTTTPKPVAETNENITSFGEGEDGEIYAVSLEGRLSRVVVAT